MAALHQRLAAALAELRATRSALLTAQRRTDETLQEQDVRLTNVEHLLHERLTAVQGQLDEMQQRLLDQVKITAAQQAVIRRAIERLGSRYQQRSGKEIYGLLHARFCAELGTPRYDALPARKYDAALQATTRCQHASMMRRCTGCVTAQQSICPTTRMPCRRSRRACYERHVVSA